MWTPGITTPGGVGGKRAYRIVTRARGAAEPGGADGPANGHGSGGWAAVGR